MSPFTEDAHNLVAIPLFHVAGKGWLFLGLAAGCSNLLAVHLNPETVPETIEQKRITYTLTIPAVIQMPVLNAKATNEQVHGLKTINFGPSPMPAELLKRAKAIFPETDFTHMYGMTETTCMFGAHGPAQLHASYVDEKGYLYIRNRIKDMLISSGENVCPAEVENAVLAHPAVADVAVIGMADEKWGEVGLAAVVKKAGANASDKEIKATVLDPLARFKVPKYIARIEALPRNDAGKVTKEILWKDLRTYRRAAQTEDIARAIHYNRMLWIASYGSRTMIIFSKIAVQ